MKVGVPQRSSPTRYRRPITPIGVRELSERGHDVLIQAGAGEGSAISDADYEAQGGRIVATAEDVFGEADWARRQGAADQRSRDAARGPDPVHLPAPRARAGADEGLCGSGAICVAYETVEDELGRLPLLAPMSEVAGKIATQAGAFMLERPSGGRGILLGGVPGVPAGNVMIIGGGAVGMHAAFVAIGMEADVFVYDVSLEKLRELDVAFGGRAATVFSSTPVDRGTPPDMDLVIGGVLVHGARAPHVITRKQLALMKPQAVLVDVAIDQAAA